MISVCVRLRHIYSHIQTCTRNEALKLFEDMFSVNFSQSRTRTRRRGHHKLLCRHIQEILFSRLVLFAQVFCRFSEYSSGTSQYQYRVCQSQIHQKTRSSYSVRAFPNPGLVSEDGLTARLEHQERKVRFLNVLVVPVSTSV
jgi:hypothetical protein